MGGEVRFTIIDEEGIEKEIKVNFVHRTDDSIQKCGHVTDGIYLFICISDLAGFN